MKHRFARPMIVGAIVVALCIVCVPCALMRAQAVQDENAAAASAASQTASSQTQTATYDKQETVYASLDATGKSCAVYVVNRFDVENAGVVVDGGSYTTTKNLTNENELTTTSDAVSFEAGVGTFFYQGNARTLMLPWDIKISYTLDDKDISADKLAGATGKLGIHIETSQNTDTSQNTAGDASFYESYMLQLTFTLNGECTRNIEAAGATIAASGQDWTVAFTALPGSDGSFDLSAQVENFSMDGAQIAALPYSSVVDVPDTSSLTSEMDTLTGAVDELSSGASSLASGADELASGASSLVSGSSNFGAGLDTIAGSSSSLVVGSQTINSSLATIASALKNLDTSSLENIPALSASLRQIASALTATAESTTDASTQASLSAQAASLNAIADALDSSLDTESLSGLSELTQGLTSLADNYEDFHSGLTAYTNGVDQLAQSYDTLDSGVSSLAAGASAYAQGVDTYAQGMTTFDESLDELPTIMNERIDELMSDYTFPEFDPISFTSADNKNTTAVQFVMTTSAISAPEATEEQPEEEGSETIWDRFVALFLG